jgi:hypothetical protein
MLKYQQISDPDKIYDCCKPDNGGDTPTGDDCCNDAWKKDLIVVTADYKVAAATATDKQSQYDLAVNLRDRLKVWVTDWELTDEKADVLCRQLELFVLHLKKVCKITEKVNDAVEILFCMIEDLYKRVDKLKIKYDEFVKCIQCLNRPEFAASLGIMPLIDEYGKKLDAVIATRDALISKVILAIELAYGLHVHICEEYGLKEVLQYWKNKLNCGCEPVEVEDCEDVHVKIEQNEGGGYKHHCHFKPQIRFPLDDDHYYKHLEEDFDKAKEEVETLKKELDKAKEKRDALLACKVGLENAIAQVDSKNK